MAQSKAKPKNLAVKLILSLMAFGAFYFLVDSFLSVFLAIAMSFLLYPIVNRLEKVSLGGHRIPTTGAVIIAFLVFGLFLFAAANILIVPLVNQVNNLMKAMPELAEKANENLTPFLGEEFHKLPPNIQEMVDSSLSSISSYLMTVLKDMVSSTVKFAKSLVGMVLVPFLAFYFLSDWRTLKSMVVSLFSYDQQPVADRVLSEIGTMLCAYVDNMFKLCFIAAAFLTVGNYVLGVQYTLVLGFLALVTEMIPMVGSVVGTLSAMFIALLQNPPLALKVMVLYLVYYQLDAQIIMPNLMGRSITLHPVLIILAVLIGGQIGGVVGLIFAVPVLIIVKVLYENFWHAGEEQAEIRR